MPLTTKVRIGRGYLWGSFLIAAAALKTPTRNGYNAQGVNLKFWPEEQMDWFGVFANCTRMNTATIPFLYSAVEPDSLIAVLRHFSRFAN